MEIVIIINIIIIIIKWYNLKAGIKNKEQYGWRYKTKLGDLLKCIYSVCTWVYHKIGSRFSSCHHKMGFT